MCLGNSLVIIGSDCVVFVIFECSLWSMPL